MGQAAGSAMVVTLLVTLSSPTLPRTLYAYLGIDLGLVSPTLNATDVSLPPLLLPQKDVLLTARPLLNISHRWFYLCSALLFFVVSSLVIFVPERDGDSPLIRGRHAYFSRHKAKSSTSDESDSRACTSQSGASSSNGHADRRSTGLRAISTVMESESETDNEVKLSPAPVEQKRRRRWGGGVGSGLRIPLSRSANIESTPPTPTSLAPLITNDEDEREDDRPVFSPLPSTQAANLSPLNARPRFPNGGRPDFPKPRHASFLDQITPPQTPPDSPVPVATVANGVASSHSDGILEPADSAGDAPRRKMRSMKMGLKDTYLCMWDIVLLKPMRQYIGLLLVFAV